MSKLQEYLSEFITVVQLEENEYQLLMPFYLEDSSTLYSIRVKLMENKLFLHDAGGTLDYLSEAREEINMSKIENLVKASKFNLTDGVINIEINLNNIELYVANLIKLITNILSL